MDHQQEAQKQEPQKQESAARIKRGHLMILAAVLAVLAVGITAAFMFRQSPAIVNLFSPAKVSCSVAEQFDGTSKKSITVQNTGNIDSYLRVRLVSYWVDGEGSVVGKTSEMPAVSPAAGWTSGGDNTYYYSEAVAPGAAKELLAAAITLRTEQWNEITVYQVVEVFAEAIQAKPVDAVKAAWPGFTPPSGSEETP